MSATTDALHDFFVNSGLLDTYTIQWTKWDEQSNSAKQRYFIITQQPGGKAEPWFTNPNYQITLIGRQKEGDLGSAGFVGEVAEELVNYIRKNYTTDCHAFVEALTGPVPGVTTENRPWRRFSIRTFTRS